MNSAPSRELTPGKRLLADLRMRILDGRLPPGTRLPSRSHFEGEFTTTPVTVQRVFDQLSRDGFVVTRGWQGTFVSELPPHLNRFACVFPYRDRPERPWPQFWHALAAEASALARELGHDLVFCYGNETHQDVEAYQELVSDVQQRRLAGLIFATKPFYLQGSPVLEAPDMPRVAIMPEPMPPNVKAVNTPAGFFDAAVDWLLAQGRRRIAAVAVPLVRQAVIDALQSRGVAVPSYWVQTALAGDAAGTRSAVQLLMASEPSRRPNGLLIMDDNLVPDATAGLLDAGLRVPQDIRVVGHANFPHATPSAMPIHRIGCDVRDVLRACLQSLEAQRCGAEAPEYVDVPLVDGATAATPRVASRAAAALVPA